MPQEFGTVARARPAARRKAPLDLGRLRRDFPILSSKVRGRPLVYLDNAATTQKPRAVLEAIARYYRQDNANVHRGIHTLSERATAAFEAVRSRVRRFLNAAEDREIVFVRGTTEAINLVASAYGRRNLKAGDEVVISAMEHHSNIVPWQMICEEKGARLRVAPIGDRGEFLMGEFERLLGERTKIVAVTHVSNALGTIVDVKEVVRASHARGIKVLVDGAQAAAHFPVDVRDLGCDFYAFSGHKALGPTGIGVLYGRAPLLEAMDPYQGGGDMIQSVAFEKTTYNVIPYKFEAGTPDIAGVIGLGAALEYLDRVGLDRIQRYERDLLAFATERLSAIPGLRIIGTAAEKACLVSFTLGDVHPHDVGTVLDFDGIAIRTGHHCAQPVMERFGVPATARASFCFYNTKKEVEALARALTRVLERFQA